MIKQEEFLKKEDLKTPHIDFFYESAKNLCY